MPGGGWHRGGCGCSRDKGTKERAGQVASASHSELLTVTGPRLLGFGFCCAEGVGLDERLSPSVEVTKELSVTITVCSNI